MPIARLFVVLGLASCFFALGLGLAGCTSVNERPGGSGSQSMPPTVTSIMPRDQEMSVSLNKPLVATFNKRMDAASVAAGGFTVMLNGVRVAGKVSLSSDGQTATFRPASALAPGATYSIKLSNIKDSKGNLMVNKSYTFQTNR